VSDTAGNVFGTYNYYQDDPQLEEWIGGGIFRLTVE
jgi:hypothetical protein